MIEISNDLGKMLLFLKNNGCTPSIYLRGSVWRAHVFRAGNFWEDGRTPTEAMYKAIELWTNAGRPILNEEASNQNS